MERGKGFECEVSRMFSASYVTLENASESPSQQADASVRVSRKTLGGDTARSDGGLPAVTPDLFLEAGLVVAGRAAHALMGHSLLESYLRQAVRQSTALRGTTSTSVSHK